MDILLVLAGVLLATAVIFVYVGFIWWLDRYEREPFWLVGLVFLWGAIGGTCFACIVSIPLAGAVGEVTTAAVAMAFSTVVIAPVVEEVTKGLIFVPLVLTHHFDNETDGLIYGAAVGLGFAAIENILYYVSAIEAGMTAVLTVIVLRTLFSSLVHAISSATLGMFIGYARHRPGASRWLIYPLIGYALAVLNHALWNGAATLSQVEWLGGARMLVFLAGLLLVILAAGVMFGLTQLSLKREHDVIRRFLELEADRGTLPRDHAEIIPYWTKRRRSDWLAPEIPRKQYVRAATLLAFRQHQLDIADGERAQRYREDIAKFREQVEGMLAGVR